MKKAWPGLLLSALVLTGCDWEKLAQAAEGPPRNEPIPCAAAFVAMGRTRLYFKLGPITDRRVELYVNEALIWTSEKPDEPTGWAQYHNGVLRYMSFEDFEELRLEERDPQGVAIREPLALKILNGENHTANYGCGDPVSRPPQMYFEF